MESLAFAFTVRERPVEIPFVPPAGDVDGVESFDDLRGRQPLQVADVDLPQLVRGEDLEGVGRRDRPGGLMCPPKVAREDSDQGPVLQFLGDEGRLSVAFLVEGDIDVSLPAQLGIPIRGTVSDEPDRLLHREVPPALV